MNPIDLTLFHLINDEWANPFLDHFLPGIASTDIWTPILIAAAVIALVWGGIRGRALVLCVGMGLLLGDSILSHTLKHLVARTRPRDAMAGVYVRGLSPVEPRILHVFDPPVVKISRGPSKAHGQSFPSSHVLNLFMLTTAAWCFHRRLGLAVGFMALLVGYSRIYTGAHWPSDIPFSALMGVLVGLIVVRVTKALALHFDWIQKAGVKSDELGVCHPLLELEER